MIQQRLLPIKLEKSDDEVIKAFGLKRVLVRHVSLSGLNRGFQAWRSTEPLALMHYGGERHIEDFRELYGG